MRKLTIVVLILILVTLSAFIGWWIGGRTTAPHIKSPINIVKPRPLDKYTIENLSQKTLKPGKFKIEEVLDEEIEFTSYLFSFELDPPLQGRTSKITTGQLNLPKEDTPYPVVIMLRGYIDQEIYKTGDGTRRAAEVFAKNGYITIAPDFLGYAGSDSEAGNIFEARFQTYVTILSLLESLDQIEKWNEKDIFLWGHSNGGQIALTVLEITGKNYPTTLWAPVSKPFPYSILYYTDEAEDRGKLIRRELAKFEEFYNPDLYSLDLYLNRLNSPLQIHQGTADDAVPVSWSNELIKTLERLKNDVTYHKYPGANHNMQPNWNTVVTRDLAFFKKHIKD